MDAIMIPKISPFKLVFAVYKFKNPFIVNSGYPSIAIARNTLKNNPFIKYFKSLYPPNFPKVIDIHNFKNITLKTIKK